MRLISHKFKFSFGLGAILALSLLAAGSAIASKSQLSVIEDPARLLSHDVAVQTATLDESKLLGADIVKVPVQWRNFAPDSESVQKPTGDLTNPDTYPAGVWDILDSAVAGIESRGMRPWLMLTAPAPRWAVPQESGSFKGAFKPNPADYADFVEAVGRRYPSVDVFSIWNEPNLNRYLQPQFSKGIAQSAVHYRDMYRAAFAALARSGNGGDTILFGELLPRAPSNGARTAPLTWLREFFCLDAKLKPFRGKAAKTHKCTGFKRISTSGLSYHPYTTANGPLTRELQRNNAPLGYLKRVENVLDAAAKHRKLARKRLKIYNSEFGIQSDPPDPYQTPIRKIPLLLNTAEYLTWIDARVATYSQYLIVDDQDIASFGQMGLRFADGSKKEGVYQAYQTPVMVFKGKSSRNVTVWGGLRAKESGVTMAEVQYKSGGSWITATQVPVGSSTGYFQRGVNVAAAASKTWRVSWSGGTSREAKPGKRVRPYTN